MLFQDYFHMPFTKGTDQENPKCTKSINDTCFYNNINNCL